MRRLLPLGVLAFVLAVAGAPTLASSAAQATPAPSPDSSPVSVAAAGLVNPRGFAFDPNGSLYVALGGAPDPSPGVVRIVGRCPEAVVGDVLTTRVAFNGLSSVADIAFLPDGKLYALVSGSDRPSGRGANGLYRVDPDGNASLLADISLFVERNSVATRPPDYDSDGQPYAMSPLPDNSGFWVAESNSGQVLKVGLDGSIVRVVDLSGLDPIPTGIVAAPGGGAYVAYFTKAPYVEGAAKVVLVGDDGSVSDVWTGLSLPTAVEIGPDGELYALEMATGFAEDGRALGPGTGRVVRQRGLSGAEPVVTGLGLPAAMAFGPDGALFVSGPTVGADDGQGTILRVDLEAGGGTPIAVPETLALPSPSACPPA